MHSYDLYHNYTHHVRTGVLEMVQSRNFQISKNRMSLLISAVRFVVFPCTWDLSNISSRMHCQSCQENLPVTLRLHTFKDLLRQRYKGPLLRENTKMRLLQRIKSWMHPPPSSAEALQKRVWLVCVRSQEQLLGNTYKFLLWRTGQLIDLLFGSL